MSTKHKTIKSVPEASLESFNEFKNNGAYANDTAAFIAMIKISNSPENLVDVKDLQGQLESLQKENTDLGASNIDLIQQKTNLEAQLAELKARLVEISTREPEKVEVPKEVPVALSPTQFIVDLPEDLVKKARMCRKKMREAGKFTGADDEFANFLTEKSINYFLKHQYEDIYDHKPKIS